MSHTCHWAGPSWRLDLALQSLTSDIPIETPCSEEASLTRGSMPTTCNQIDAGKAHVDFAGKDSPIKNVCVTHTQDQSQRDLLCRDGPGSSHDETVLSTGKDLRKSYSFSPFTDAMIKAHWLIMNRSLLLTFPEDGTQRRVCIFLGHRLLIVSSHMVEGAWKLCAVPSLFFF